VLRLRDIERLARLGVIASMQPTHATSDMPWAQDRLGEARLAGAYAWRKVLAAGGRLALGSDFPVESADPRLGLYAAVTRQDLAGQPPGGWLPNERLSLADAIAAWTSGAAYAEHMEQRKGRLEVGMLADIAVLDRDLRTTPSSEIVSIKVEATAVGGRLVYEARE